jgi:hypothetical protein
MQSSKIQLIEENGPSGQGTVINQFPTGGKGEPQVHEPLSGRSGVIPEPTVQSGCEKEIAVAPNALILAIEAFSFYP